MKIPDVNVLVYAVNTAAPKHRSAKTWLNNALSGHETIGLDWLGLIAFVRLSTHPGIFPKPLTCDDALDLVDSWTAARCAEIIKPASGHSQRLRTLLATTGTGGNLTNDAHLAALALDNDAEIITYDTDFARFPGLRWSQPE